MRKKIKITPPDVEIAQECLKRGLGDIFFSLALSTLQTNGMDEVRRRFKLLDASFGIKK